MATYKDNNPYSNEDDALRDQAQTVIDSTTQYSQSRAIKASPKAAHQGGGGYLPTIVKKQFRDCDVCPEMAFIPGGSIMIGGEELDVDKPIHKAYIASYWVAKTEVTQKQWKSLMGYNPSHNNSCVDCPVENITYREARKYVERLSAHTGNKYRLPSEAEWEYMCRIAGLIQSCAVNDGLKDWYWENSGDRTHPVAGKVSNGFGLFDVNGNASEWVDDCWHENYIDAPLDGEPWIAYNCKLHMYRGQSFDGAPWPFGAVGRISGQDAKFKSKSVGVRPVRESR